MQIITLGGGGFSMEPENPPLDNYILSQARKPKPNVCFVGTAGGDSADYCMRFYAAFSDRDCVPTHLPLFKRTTADLRQFVLRQDVIYVGGGNTANLPAIWRAHGLDTILREAAEQGTLLCGISAGSICWYESGVTDSFGPELAALTNGLGFLTGSNCPHYDGEPRRRPTYHRLIAGGMQDGYAADDGCALHFQEGRLKRAVASRPGASVYRVDRVGGIAVETKLPADWVD
jgi:dipeptidase E